MRNGVCKADQIKFIMECRQSGLSDYQWCEQNGIHAGTFYNWVSKLRKSGYTFPESSSRADIKPNSQDVVKVDLIEPITPKMEQNVSLIEESNFNKLAAELQIGNITLRLFNGADEQVVQNTLRYLGGVDHAW